MKELLGFLNVHIPMWPLYILGIVFFKPYKSIRDIKGKDKLYRVIFLILDIAWILPALIGIALAIWYHPPGRYGITSFAAPFALIPFAIGEICILLCYFATEIIPRIFRRK